jgi:Sulfotransferase family
VPVGKPNRKVKVLYIAGLGRSGSTILGNVLGGIEGFFHGGEFNFIWEHNLTENRLCSCGVPFDECEIWGSVFETAFGGMDGVDSREMARLQTSGARTRHVPLMLFPQGRRMLASRLGKYMVRLERLYRAVQESTGSRVIVDSSKFPSYGYVLGMTPGIDLYAVQLIRDPRAAAYSWLKEPRPDTDKRAYMNRVSTVKSALLWDAWNVSSEALWKDSPGRYMRLRYEDFVAEPRRAVEGILGMLHEDADRLPFVGERDVELEAGHTVAGNPNRFQNGLVRLRPDVEWELRMRSWDKTTVTLLTLPLLARYGYPVSTRKIPAS